ncbi:MAG: amidohydrolase [Bacteroidales bacterium]|nr:amidohydrolase [Bacteroidales bacterium]
MQPLNEFLPQLISLRKEFHHNPEFSGKEFKTAGLIHKFCLQFKPTRVIEKLGKTGLAVIFDSGHPGKTVLFRADMDALPIEEDIEVPYTSSIKSLSHKCGHDGHMAMICGLAFLLHQHPIHKGKVVLLFQPAEEVGKGALQILKDPKFKEIEPDYVFALHNLPGFPRNSICVREGVFALASEGVLVRLKGNAAHAAYPDQGISPLPAVMELIEKVRHLPDHKRCFQKFVQLSVTYAKIGQFGFGTIPGTADLALTLRAELANDLEQLHTKLVSLVAKTATQNYLEESFKRYEPFAPTGNDQESVQVIRNVALRHLFPLIELKEPLRWSEDFGQFTARYKGAIFGLGAGENHSDLHTCYYDFPDEILETGIKMFFGITQDLLND